MDVCRPGAYLHSIVRRYLRRYVCTHVLHHVYIYMCTVRGGMVALHGVTWYFGRGKFLSPNNGPGVW